MQAGEILKEQRKALKLNQSEAASKVGVSFSTWERWERGVQEVNAPSLAGSLLLLGASATAAKAAAAVLLTESK